MQSVVDDLRRVRDRGGEEEPPTPFDGAREIWRDWFAQYVFEQVRTGSIFPGRTCLSDTGTSVAHTDVAVGRAGKGELREARVLAGFDEGQFLSEFNRRRRRA